MPRYALAAAAAAAAIGTGLFATTPLWNPPAGCGCNTPSYATAQEYVSPSGTDTGSCSTSGTACLTLNYAGSQASCGNTIQVAGGTYSSQTIASTVGSSCTSGTRIQYVNAPGSTPTIDGLIVNGSHLDFYGLTDDGGQASNDVLIQHPASDVVYEHGTIRRGRLVVAGAANVTASYDDIGGCSAGASNQNCPVKLNVDGGGNVPSNVTLSHDTIHDMTSTDTNLYHVECMFIQAVNGLTIDHSEFYHCQIFDIFMQQTGLSGTNVSNVTIKDDLFGASYDDSAFTSENGSCVQVDGRPGSIYSSVEFEFDSFYFDSGLNAQGKNLGCELEFNQDTGSAGWVTGSTVLGNAGIVHVNAECVTGTTWSYNVEAPFSAGQVTACGSNNTLGSSGSPNTVIGYTTLADLPSGNFQLAAGSSAVGYVPVASCLSDDYAGVSRPNSGHSSFCNAGAYENR